MLHLRMAVEDVVLTVLGWARPDVHRAKSVYFCEIYVRDKYLLKNHAPESFFRRKEKRRGRKPDPALGGEGVISVTLVYICKNTSQNNRMVMRSSIMVYSGAYLRGRKKWTESR